MGLPWVRMDTALTDHPKILELINTKKKQAASVYIFGILYCGRHELDGYIPAAALPFIHGTKADAEALCHVGLWHQKGNGYEINGWADYQLSNEESRRRKAKAQAAANIRWTGQNDAS